MQIEGLVRSIVREGGGPPPISFYEDKKRCQTVESKSKSTRFK
jgi:hypothetical protein